MGLIVATLGGAVLAGWIAGGRVARLADVPVRGVPPAVAGAVVFLGSTDSREFKRTVSPTTAVFNRAQMAWSVVIEGWIFHHLASLAAPWWVLGPAVLAAGIVGYGVNAILVAVHVRVSTQTP